MELTREGIIYFCYLVENISRFTRNAKKDIIKHYTMEDIIFNCDNEGILHCSSIDELVFNECEKYGISRGRYNHVTSCRYRVPSANEAAMVYSRLIISIAKHRNKTTKSDLAEIVIEVYNSNICGDIDNYNGVFYTLAPQVILECYLQGSII